MSSFSILSILPWFLASLVVAALHITSALILVKKRQSGPILMLVGSAVVILGQFANAGLQVFRIGPGSIPKIYEWLMATAAFSALGSLLFAIGLLLYALQQRGKANRIAELEAILNSRLP